MWFTSTSDGSGTRSSMHDCIWSRDSHLSRGSCGESGGPDKCEALRPNTIFSFLCTKFRCKRPTVLSKYSEYGLQKANCTILERLLSQLYCSHDVQYLTAFVCPDGLLPKRAR